MSLSARGSEVTKIETLLKDVVMLQSDSQGIVEFDCHYREKKKYPELKSGKERPSRE